MWIPKWYWEAKLRQETELERRVKRLELIILEDAGSMSVDDVSAIEETASQPGEKEVE